MKTLTDLVGETIKEITMSENRPVFLTENYIVKFEHDQDCCETVDFIDTIGNLEDLIGSPLTMAEEVYGEEPTDYEYKNDRHTWTFYKFATVKGYVTFSFLGESNGYYNERMDVSVERI